KGGSRRDHARDGSRRFGAWRVLLRRRPIQWPCRIQWPARRPRHRGAELLGGIPRLSLRPLVPDRPNSHASGPVDGSGRAGRRPGATRGGTTRRLGIADSPAGCARSPGSERIERHETALLKERVMRHIFSNGITLAVALLAGPAGAAGAPSGPLTKCPVDAVVAGAGCMDKYEASVWRVPNPTTTNAALVRRIQLGRATQADLTAGGATQLGTAIPDYAPCTANGQNCTNDIYAVSLPSVLPSAFITWFQAQEACANAGKRLPTSAEWQVAANGTPDPGPDNGTTDCNVGDGTVFNDGPPSLTGARSGCVSARGAFDMVGNLLEWVADWVPASTNSPGWGGFSNDLMSLSGASTTSPAPGALVRGGAFFFGPSAGPLMVGDAAPNLPASDFVGFRCVR